ncbi:ATP-binding protein [Microbispora sp. RL4-1S]|uniref:ATP-binding protein n=1 Tax=Microbispora oryzae TaxID=2806554 RepID=A0A940WD10_9ACTN|nr:ATP-binding protein [Microbispora oryzae]MBP2703186.1 ATP-binding protein [Microbispora oryzae]
MTLPLGPAPLDADPVWTAECLLPAVPASVASARSLVRRELTRWGLDAMVDDCSLVVSELASNVVRHGGTVFTLRLGSNGTWVYGEIFDQGEGLPRQREADMDSTDGRGLLIVRELADDWGVVRSARGGKTVWFITGAETPATVPIVPSRARLAVG